MRGRLLTVVVAGLVAGGAGQAPHMIATATPFEALEQCFRAKLAGTGKLTAINTAAGTMLDVAFDAVGTDGKVAQSRAIFSIEDRGVERRVAASSADPADTRLATQMLDQTMAACAPDIAKR